MVPLAARADRLGFIALFPPKAARKTTSLHPAASGLEALINE
jgi:hypothetical protein